VFAKTTLEHVKMLEEEKRLTIIRGACVKTTNLLCIYNRFWKHVHFASCPQCFGSIVNLVVRLQSKKSTTLPQFWPCGKLQKQRWCYILCFLKWTFFEKCPRNRRHVAQDDCFRDSTKTLGNPYKYTIHDEGFHSRHVGLGEPKGRTDITWYYII
jgi:hypothetical protein